MKYFNNVTVYWLPEPINWFSDELDEQLAKHASYEPASHQLNSAGFVWPSCIEGEFVSSIPFVAEDRGLQHGFLVQIQVIERLLPAKAVRRAVESRARDIQKEQGRVVRGSEKQRIKAEIVEKMLPRCFTVSTDIHVLLTSRYIFVDQTSASKAELAMSLLREAVGTLPVRPLQTVMPASTGMSSWAVQGETPVETLQLGNSFKLEDISEGGATLSGARLDLSDTDAELLSELSRGRVVTEMGLVLTGTGGTLPKGSPIPFTLTEKYVLKGIDWPREFLDVATDQLGDSDDHASIVEVNNMLVLTHLLTLTHRLVEALGGLSARGLGSVTPPTNTSLGEEDELI